MITDQYDALEECLAALEAGADLESVLGRYPAQRRVLQPLLETALAARQLAGEPAPAEVFHRSRTRLLAQAADRRAQSPSGYPRWQRLPRLGMAALVVLVILLSGGGLVAVSAQALPGDQLYPIKRVSETIQLDLTFDAEAHRLVEARFQERRLAEVEKLLALSRSEMVVFYGVVAQQGQVQWLIDAVRVVITPETLVIGEITPGVLVEVEGSTHAQGWVQAAEIHLQAFELRGQVEAISPSSWIIAGRQIAIDASSQFPRTIQVGDYVIATVRSDDFGNLWLRSAVLAEAPAPTATPFPTATPSPTAAPAPDESGDNPRQEETETSEEGDEVERHENEAVETEDAAEDTDDAEPETTETPGDDQESDSGATETPEEDSDTEQGEGSDDEEESDSDGSDMPGGEESEGE